MIHYMNDRYEISMGELKCEHPEKLGYFALTFLVRPPVEFTSEQANAELGHHILNTINALSDGFFHETNTGPQSEHAMVSFTHELPDKSATVGTISGHAEIAQLTNKIILSALETVLNGAAK
jgi:hypothetical protein